MQEAPRRLKPKRFPLLRRPQTAADETLWNSLSLPRNRHMVRWLRALRRGLLLALWTLLSMAVQATLILLPGRAKVAFARMYWAMACRLIGLRVRVIGARARRTRDGRPIVYVSNHSSWLDIPVLGGQLDACFIAKEQIDNWPFINLIARLGRTVWVRRRRASTGRERDDMRDRMAAGDSLVLFPEGTTSDGSRVLPFRSTFLSVAQVPVTPDGLPPLVQPVSVVYDRLAWLPTGRASRPLFAWYGDMNIGSHFWRLAQYRGLRATVLLHTPLDPRDFASRKALAQAVFTAVADGASVLRQNRPARPLTATGPSGEAETTDPVFA